MPSTTLASCSAEVTTRITTGHCSGCLRLQARDMREPRMPSARYMPMAWAWTRMSRKRCAGIARLPRQACHPRNMRWAMSCPKARASRRMIRRPSIGSARPLTMAMPRPHSGSARCMPMARGVSKDDNEKRRWACRAAVLGSDHAMGTIDRHGGFDNACAGFTQDLSAFAREVLGKAPADARSRATRSH